MTSKTTIAGRPLAELREVEAKRAVAMVAEAMKRAGLSVYDMAGEIGCSHTTVYSWLHGKRLPSPMMVRVIHSALKVILDLNAPKP